MSAEPNCGKALLSGYTVDGSFQQYCVAKAAHVARIPKEIDLAQASPILCAGITVYKGLKESGARPGESVAIVGAGGGLGSIACQYAKAMGLQVIAIDAGDDKKKLCIEMGATSFVDFSTSQDVVKDVQAATSDGLGPHAVLLVAVSEKPFQQAAEVKLITCTILPSYSQPIRERIISLPLHVLSCSLPVPALLNSSIVCPHPRHSCRHRPAGRRLSQSAGLPDGGPLHHHQGIVRRKPQGQRRSHRFFPSGTHQSVHQDCWPERVADGLRSHEGG